MEFCTRLVVREQFEQKLGRQDILMIETIDRPLATTRVQWLVRPPSGAVSVAPAYFLDEGETWDFTEDSRQQKEWLTTYLQEHSSGLYLLGFLNERLAWPHVRRDARLLAVRGQPVAKLTLVERIDPPDGVLHGLKDRSHPGG